MNIKARKFCLEIDAEYIKLLKELKQEFDRDFKFDIDESKIKERSLRLNLETKLLQLDDLVDIIHVAIATIKQDMINDKFYGKLSILYNELTTKLIFLSIDDKIEYLSNDMVNYIFNNQSLTKRDIEFLITYRRFYKNNIEEHKNLDDFLIKSLLKYQT